MIKPAFSRTLQNAQNAPISRFGLSTPDLGASLGMAGLCKRLASPVDFFNEPSFSQFWESAFQAGGIR